MQSFIVLLGPPGVGKGTQAEILSTRIGLPHVSSGDLFRDNIKGQTDLGKKAQAFMDQGELVPDDLTIAMVRDRLHRTDCAGGAILDGFPRTPGQADALQAMLRELGTDVQVVPFITAAPQVLIERVGGRWTCRAGGHVYHEAFSPPKVPGKCDYDDSELYQREDDKAETVSRRIRVYLEQTAPLVDYYRAKGKLVEIDGAQSIDAVTAELLRALGKDGQ